LTATFVLEFFIFFIGIFLYSKATRAKNKRGSIGFWGLIVFFLLIHFSNMFGPPPPSVSMIAWAGHLQWIFVIWAYWIDRNRTAVS
jgi:hypothetical protein